MKNLWLFILIMLIISTIDAKCDMLVLNGNCFKITSQSPLEHYPFVKELKTTLIDYKANCYDCFCYNYDAEWTIINNQLFLTNIFSCSDHPDRKKADLNTLFNVSDGKVKADWFTDTLWISRGPVFHTRDMEVIRQSETRIIVANGNVLSIKEYDHEDAYEPPFIRNPELLKRLIIKNIRWNKIPKLPDSNKRVMVSLTIGAPGPPQNVKILRGPKENIYKKEALRIINSMQYGIFYRYNKPLLESWTIPISFNEQYRALDEKYN